MNAAARILALALALAASAGPAQAEDTGPADARWAEIFAVELPDATGLDAAQVDWAELVAMDDGELPPFVPPPTDRFGREDERAAIAAWAATYGKVMQQAYAHAVLGHSEYARYLVQHAEGGLAAARAASNDGEQRAQRLVTWVEREMVRKIAAHVEARIALSEGREAEARVLAHAAMLDGPTGTELALATGLSPPAPSRAPKQGRSPRVVALALADVPVKLPAIAPFSPPAVQRLSPDSSSPAFADPALEFANFVLVLPDFSQADTAVPIAAPAAQQTEWQNPRDSRYLAAIRWMIHDATFDQCARVAAPVARFAAAEPARRANRAREN